MNTLTRRNFLGRTLAIGAGLSSLALGKSGKLSAALRTAKDDISLAAWSLVRDFRQGKWKNLDLPRICREDFDINGIEFVNTFFEVPTNGYLNKLKKNADDYGVKMVLIMVDGEGEMASSSKKDRMQTVINHRKWVDIAQYLGCHSIRTNCRGPKDASREDVLNWAEESFNYLLEYAVPAKMSVVIENHGGLSSDPDFLVSLMERVNNLYFGLLPDFGNFIKDVDLNEVLRKVVPYATGISVKSYFTAQGTHPRYDLERCVKTCHDAGYRGFYGIEAEGRESSSYEQVRLTKKVLDKVLFGKG
ncbi:sugar phosphate isomerase/epimerase family protein [candidate division KSB1 bacterium]